MYPIMKRIHKEMEDNSTRAQVFQTATIKYDFVNSTIRVTIDNKKFHISNNYPFARPIVFINGMTYLQYMKPPTKRIYRIMSKLKYECPCCNTILSNWSSVYTITKILDEIDNFNHIKRAVKHYIAVEELGKKYRIISQLPNEILAYL